ncbi:MAG: hypothetical protein HY934_04860 [Candidatus Firestonebacteria bacterium]|nr:hypothetical protein [Candidatus Firestonebacteria bacterium]
MKLKYSIFFIIILLFSLEIHGKEKASKSKPYTFYVYNEVEKKDISYNQAETFKNKIAEKLKKTFNMQEQNESKNADIIIISSVFLYGNDYYVYYIVQVPFKRFIVTQTFNNKIDFSKVINRLCQDLEMNLAPTTTLPLKLAQN